MEETTTQQSTYFAGDNLGDLFAALSQAQSEMAPVFKEATNPHFKSKYAGLPAVCDAVIPALNKHGIAVIQSPESNGSLVVVETILAHKGGARLHSRLGMRPTKADPQGVGSCITYARRYALLAIAGVAPEDDDGNAASTPQEAPKRTSAALKRDGAWQEMQAKLRDCAKPSEAMEVFHETNLSGWPAAWIDALANEMAKVFIDDMQDCPTDELDAWGRHWADEIKALPEEARLTIREEIKRRRAAVS